MTSRISHTTFDCRDAFALSEFWKQVLGYGDVPGDPNEPGHEECMIVGPGTEPKLLFIEVPEGKQVKNRVHPDLQPTDRARRDASARPSQGRWQRLAGPGRSRRQRVLHLAEPGRTRPGLRSPHDDP